jgi:hypothetical protein
MILFIGDRDRFEGGAGARRAMAAGGFRQQKEKALSAAGFWDVKGRKRRNPLTQADHSDARFLHPALMTRRVCAPFSGRINFCKLWKNRQRDTVPAAGAPDPPGNTLKPENPGRISGQPTETLQSCMVSVSRT